ncbi:MAG: ArsR family transcriptional regulator [[Eubacterium] rectale]|nr:ArsR family transcriptional regulator [Agathobacter rectalis]
MCYFKLLCYCSHLTVRPATITAHLKCLYEAGL